MPASLEIIITDNGQSPIGMPPPPSSGLGQPVITPPASPAPPAGAPAAQAAPTPPAAQTVAPPASPAPPAGAPTAQTAPAPTAAQTVAPPQTSTAGPGTSASGIKPVTVTPTDVTASEGLSALAGSFGAGGIATFSQTITQAVTGFQAASAAGGGAAASLGALVGPATLAASAVVGLGFAAKKVADMIEDDARRLSEYSDKLAISTAQADLRQQLAEIERAQRNGEGLAQFQDVKSKIDTDMYRVMTALEDEVVNVITPILEAIEPLLHGYVNYLTVIADGVGIIASILTLHIPTAAKLLQRFFGDIEKMLREAIDRTDDDPLNDPFTQDIMGNLIAGGGGGGDGAGQMQPADPGFPRALRDQAGNGIPFGPLGPIVSAIQAIAGALGGI